MRIIQKISIKKINLDTAQPRQIIKEDKLLDLAQDIKKRGLIYPIILTPFKKHNDVLILGNKALNYPDHMYWILDGERRFRAYKLNKNVEIEAEIRNDLTFLEMLEIQFASNSKRVETNPYDMAVAMKRYIEEYKSEYDDDKYVEKLADLTGFSTTFINSRLEILQAPQFIQDLVKNNETRSNLPIEIKNNIKNERDKEAIYNAFKEDKLVSTLDCRPLGKKLKKVDEISKINNYSEKERNDIADVVIETFRLPEEEQDGSGNYEIYKYQIDEFCSKMSRWNLKEMNNKQLSKLSGSMCNITNLFRDLWKQAKGLKKLPRGMTI